MTVFLSCFTFFTTFADTNADTNEDVLKAQNEFGHRLLRDILEKEQNQKNVFISPPSAFLALSMLLEGAESTTRQSILTGLNLNNGKTFTNQDIHLANQDYMNALLQGAGSDAQTLILANGIFVETSFPLRKTYIDALDSYYDVWATNVEFSQNPEEAADIINAWAARSTRDRIDQVITADAARDLVLLLANAIYFKGTWENKFDSDDTRSIVDYFTMSDGTKVEAQVMSRLDDMKYYKNSETGTQALHLPFEGERTSFYIVLPPVVDGEVNSKEWVAQNAMNDDFWRLIDNESTFSEVDLELPKFKFKTKRELNDNLTQLGMGEIFSPNADFSRLSAKQTYVSFVNQDAFIQVDEEGAEAAAVTTIGITPTSMPMSIPFYVNRPFLMAIRDKVKGTFLFYGFVERPVWED